jgi:hypothetical protein
VAAAVAAHKSGIWGKTTGAQRAVVLRAIAQKVCANCHSNCNSLELTGTLAHGILHLVSGPTAGIPCSSCTAASCSCKRIA